MINSANKRLRQDGVTLIELMVALVIGLLLVIAMSAIFVNSSTSRRELALSAEVIENGRYGLDLLTRELSQTGFYGTLSTPTGSTQDECSTDEAEWADSLLIHVKGLNNADADPACLTRKADTDAIFVQRSSTCRVGEIECDAESDKHAYLQVSECGEEYNSKPFVLDKGLKTTFTLQTKPCNSTTKAEKRRLIRRIYYISTASALSYVDIRLDGPTAPVALVEDIEQMQFEYAIDSDGDGTVDSFGSTPADWAKVIGARVWLLARSSSTSRNAADAITFTMADKTVDISASSSNLKRRVYSTYISFVTPKSRMEF
jgi:type IV pilus assembly protein PilW